MSRKRHGTNYPGIFYRIVPRLGSSGTEKMYWIVYKKNGRIIEEKAGRQYADDMTPAKAALIRGELIEGKRLRRVEIRKIEEEKKKTEENRWTLDKLFKEYQKSKGDYKSKAQDSNRFKLHLDRLKDKEPKEIHPLDIDRLRIGLSKTHKLTTAHHVLELLRRTINFGVNKNLIAPVAYKVKLPKLNNEKTESLNDQQIKKLLEALDKETDVNIANLVRLALYTGMRRGELFNLKWSDIDYERGFIRIRNPKGGKDASIPLNNSARQVLHDTPETEGTPYVFPGKDGERRVEAKRILKRIKESAGLPSDFRPLHGLRHAFASALASSGQVDLYTISKLLTHKSTGMTARYAHLRDESLKRASNLVVELFNPLKKKAKAKK